MKIPKFIEQHGFWIIAAVVGYLLFLKPAAAKK